MTNHLDACDACRTGIVEIRALARLTQEALATAGPSGLAAAARARARRRSPFAKAAPFATGLAAAAAVLLTLTSLRPSPHDAGAAHPTIVFHQPTDNTLDYVVHGPGGDRRGQIDLTPHYILEDLAGDLVSRETF